MRLLPAGSTSSRPSPDAAAAVAVCGGVVGRPALIVQSPGVSSDSYYPGPEGSGGPSCASVRASVRGKTRFGGDHALFQSSSSSSSSFLFICPRIQLMPFAMSRFLRHSCFSRSSCSCNRRRSSTAALAASAAGDAFGFARLRLRLDLLTVLACVVAISSRSLRCFRASRQFSADVSSDPSPTESTIVTPCQGRRRLVSASVRPVASRPPCARTVSTWPLSS